MFEWNSNLIILYLIERTMEGVNIILVLLYLRHASRFQYKLVA